ncbi:uncharacterized protein zgc:113426 isoform X2 [Acanthopagrus latus]|uniref:uncharacterized protein zgc:113426 isoform X2 n=1 Tax=Acanthopagrus latus TaxID=8177 RepID=UPI00187BE9A2|nr:uncharacterized protein zgc:113426 isoform X2 [Acanthopagrus latus]
MANAYRMTDRDIRLMIQLRATNEAIFTGRKNSAMIGWRAIRKEMGLQGLMSARQLKKKWGNLKDKYKVLKNPPEGIETQPSSWRWFHLMDKAMTGRLAGTATIVQPSLLDDDEEPNAALPPVVLPNMVGACSGLSLIETGTLEGVGTLEKVLELSGTESPVEVTAAGTDMMETQSVMNKSEPAELYATLLPDCSFETNTTPSSSRDISGETDRKLVELQKERQALEREQAEFDRELICLERDRELLNRDMVTLERDRMAVERDRATVERDRAAVERDRVFLDRDRAFLDRDRAFLERDRVFLDRAKEDLQRERALLRRERAVLETDGVAVDGEQAEMATEKEVVLQTRFYQRLVAADLDRDQLETRQRLVSLFQKLVEKLNFHLKKQFTLTL